MMLRVQLGGGWGGIPQAKCFLSTLSWTSGSRHDVIVMHPGPLIVAAHFRR
jgi:hypothetical protein